MKNIQIIDGAIRAAKPRPKTERGSLVWVSAAAAPSSMTLKDVLDVHPENEEAHRLVEALPSRS